MPWHNRLFHFYLDASIHVAFAVFALVKVSGHNLNLPYNGHLAWFTFFGTICCYNFVKYGVEAKKYLLVSTSYQRYVQWVSFLAGAIACYHLFNLSKTVWATLLPVLLAVALYALPLLPRSKNLRNWAGLKVFIVAGVWAATTVVLPVMEVGATAAWALWVEALQRFLFVFVLLLPFEVRDLAFDAPELKTLPQRFGVFKTKVTGIVVALFFFVLSFYKDRAGDLLPAEGLVFIVLVALLLMTQKRQPRYFASFVVESVPLLWWLLTGIL